MSHLSIIVQKEYRSRDLSFCINEYKIDRLCEESIIINEFLNPEYFKHKDFHEKIRASNKTGFLDHAFNLKNIDVNDFRIYNKNEILVFFKENISPYFDEPDIIAAKSELYKTFLEIVNQHETQKFYLITIDWFDTKWDGKGNPLNEKLTYDAAIYGVYFLIIWFDFERMKLIVCQSIWD